MSIMGIGVLKQGAIAKILNLNDNSLKDVPYYLYDLVHYKKCTRKTQ